MLTVNFLFEALFLLIFKKRWSRYVVIVTFVNSWYFKISNILVEYFYFEHYKFFIFKITLKQSMFALSFLFVVLFDVTPPRNTRCKSITSLALEYWLLFWKSQNLSMFWIKFQSNLAWYMVQVSSPSWCPQWQNICQLAW